MYKEIADRLGLTVGTVKQHIHRMYAKLHVQNRVEAVNRCDFGADQFGRENGAVSSASLHRVLSMEHCRKRPRC